MKTQKFTFYPVTIKYTIRLIAWLFIGLVPLIASVFILDEIDEDLIFPISGSLGLIYFGGMIYIIVKAIKANKNKVEVIEFFEGGFHSKQFGEIRFQDIADYRVFSGFTRINMDKPAPSMKIRLKNGRKIRFDLNIREYNKEIHTYLAFIDAFVIAMAPEKESDSITEHFGASSSSKFDGKTHHQKAEDQKRNYEEASENLQKAKKRTGRKIAIPVSLAVGILIFARTCIPDIAEKFKDRPIRDMRQYTNQRFDTQKNRIREVMKGKGSVFLFTNDSTARAQLYPNLPTDSNNYNTGILMFQKANFADKVEKFLQHEDSLGYSTMVVLPQTQFIQSARFGLPEGEDYNYLYFTVYDSQNQLPKRTTTVTPNTQQKMRISWGVAYKESDSLPARINNAFPSLKQFGKIFDTVKGFKLYVTAAKCNGMTQAEFEQAVKVIKEILTKNKVDMSKFKTENFNKTRW